MPLREISVASPTGGDNPHQQQKCGNQENYIPIVLIMSMISTNLNNQFIYQKSIIFM